MRNSKSTAILTMAIAVVLMTAIGAQAGDGKWFDMENCAMCESVAKKPELMQNIQRETVKTSDGIATVCSVPPEMLADYRALNKEMELKGKRLEKGEKMELCGFCTNYGSLMEKGATREYIPTANGGLTLFTGNNSSLQKQIWSFHDRTEKEFKVMMAEQKKYDHDDHEGHSH